MEVKFNDRERQVVGRLLTERKALLIETTEDTTQPDSARRSGSIELLVIESILGKLSCRDLTSTGSSGSRAQSLDAALKLYDPPSLISVGVDSHPSRLLPKGAHQRASAASFGR